MKKIILFFILFSAFFSILRPATGIKGLHAEGPYPGMEEKLSLFGPFVGDWEFDMVLHPPDGSTYESLSLCGDSKETKRW